MPSALLLLAPGAEEMETVISADVMRRGEIDVTIACVNGTDPAECSRKVKIVPDVALDAVKDKQFDAVVMPGGMPGAKTLAESPVVGEILKKQEGRGGVIASVCASPIALNSHGIGKGKKITSHPSVKDQLAAAYSYQEERVVVDGKLITSRGPGTCFEFALAIVEALQGKDKRNAIMPPMILPTSIV